MTVNESSHMRMLAALALMLAGCAKQIPLDEYCTEVVRAVCKKEQRCGRVSKHVDCSQYQLPADACLHDIQPALDSKQATYDAVAAPQCLTFVQDEVCDAYTGASFEARRACLKVFASKKKQGESCGVCAAGLQCIAESITACGTCQAIPESFGLRAVGESCDFNSGVRPTCVRGASCAYPSAICTRKKQQGDTCDAGGFECDEQFACIGAECAPLRDLYEPCDRNEDCLLGLMCSGGTCAIQLGIGAACEYQEECLSGICLDGHCAIEHAIGSSCDEFTPYSCGGGLSCDSHTNACVTGPKVGEPCDYGTCSEGECIDRTCQRTTESCN